MKNNISLFSAILGVILGFVLAYLSTFMQDKTTSLLKKTKENKVKTFLFIVIYLTRYSIYAIILFVSLKYLSANLIFAIISFNIFFILLIWKKSNFLKNIINERNK